MRIVIQRVTSASVEVDKKIVGSIETGLLVLVGFEEGDTESCLEKMAIKMLEMRIFPDSKGRFDTSVLDVGGAVLLVPQFTLLADTKKGRRPDFFRALNPAAASKLFDLFVSIVREKINVARGIFGADMKVSLTNDGPVTIIVDDRHSL